jgi:hypothetical protein
MISNSDFETGWIDADVICFRVVPTFAGKGKKTKSYPK